MEIGPEVSRGSCRSIAEFHITDALDETADLLVRHGGHAQAAGLTLRNENIALFTSRMKELPKTRLAGQELNADPMRWMRRLSLDEIDWALYETLHKLEPTGYANPTPVFLSKNVEVMSHRVVGQRWYSFTAAFKQPEWWSCPPNNAGNRFSTRGLGSNCHSSLMSCIQLTSMNGMGPSLQLMVQDLRPFAVNLPNQIAV